MKRRITEGHVITVVIFVVACLLSGCGGTASTTVSSPPPLPVVGISVTPSSVTLNVGDGQQFTAHVTGTSNTSVTWSVQEGPAGGAISTSGFYQAPNSPGTFHVIAASQADTSKTFVATISVNALPPPPPPPDPWSRVSIPTMNAVSDLAVQQIVIDVQDSSIWYVAADSGLFITRDGGATWTLSVAASSPASNIIAPDPTNINRVFYGQGGDLYVSLDRGLTWSLTGTFAGYFRSLLVSRTDPHTIFLGLQDSGGMSYRSTNDGATWDAFSFGLGKDAANILPWVIAEDALDGTLYVGAELADHPQPYAPPFFRSFDRGVTWENVAGPGAPDYSTLWWHVISAVVDPTSHKVYALQEGAGLYTSLDHGKTWTASPNVVFFTCGLLRDPNVADRFFGGWAVGRTLTGGALVSTDGAQTFQSFGLDNLEACGLALNGDSSSIYAAVYGSGIYKRSLQ